MPSTMDASTAESEGRIILLISFFFASTEIGKAPLTALSLPSSASSPRKTVSLVSNSFITEVAESNPTAIGKSNELPSFLISAGARFTVIFLLEIQIRYFLLRWLHVPCFL